MITTYNEKDLIEYLNKNFNSEITIIDRVVKVPNGFKVHIRTLNPPQWRVCETCNENYYTSSNICNICATELI